MPGIPAKEREKNTGRVEGSFLLRGRLVSRV